MEVLEDDKFKVSFFGGSSDIGICSASNMVEYTEALTSQLNTKSTSKKSSFKRALAAIRAEEFQRAISKCYVGIKRLSSSELDELTKRRKIVKIQQQDPEGLNIQLRPEDLIFEPINIQDSNIPFDKLGPSCRQFLGLNMNEAQGESNAVNKIEQAASSSQGSASGNLATARQSSAPEPSQVPSAPEATTARNTWEFVEISHLLEQALFSEKLDLSTAVELLEKLKREFWSTVDISKLHLVPDAIDVIRRATLYVGVIDQCLTDHEAGVLIESIEYIRELASNILDTLESVWVRF